MTVCEICLQVFVPIIDNVCNVDYTSLTVMKSIRNFVHLKKNDPIRDAIRGSLTSSSSTLKINCVNSVFRVCNLCLNNFKVISTLKSESKINYSIEDIYEGKVPFSSCKCFLNTEKETIRFEHNEIKPGVYKQIDDLFNTFPDHREPETVRKVICETFVSYKPSSHWLTTMSNEHIVVCNHCICLAWKEQERKISKVPSLDTKSTFPKMISGFTSTAESSSKQEVPYFRDIRDITSDTKNPPGSLNESSWKIHLIPTGQESNMWTICKNTNIVNPLDWRTVRSRVYSGTDLEIQYKVITDRLKSLMNPPQWCSISSSENRYALYILENADFTEKDSFDDKLTTIFRTLLNINVKQESFSAFRAVYIGLWNLCTDEHLRKRIAKDTLHLFGHSAYRAPLFKFLLNEINLLSLYDHEEMFREPKLNEQIWFLNYKYLERVAEMRNLEETLNPPTRSTYKGRPKARRSSRYNPGKQDMKYTKVSEIERAATKHSSELLMKEYVYMKDRIRRNENEADRHSDEERLKKEDARDVSSEDSGLQDEE